MRELAAEANVHNTIPNSRFPGGRLTPHAHLTTLLFAAQVP